MYFSSVLAWTLGFTTKTNGVETSRVIGINDSPSLQQLLFTFGERSFNALLIFPWKIVYPSAGDLTTSRAPIKLLPPSLLSMKTSYPKLSFKAGMISLTTASGSLPGPVGSKILMDLLGQVWEEPIIAKRKKPKNILSFMIFFILKKFSCLFPSLSH
jgi:hypothetical protein